MDFADTPTVENNPVSGGEIGVFGLHDFTSKVDAGDHRPMADDRAFAGDRQPVLVVDRRVQNLNRHIPFHEIGFADLVPIDGLAVICFRHHEGFELIHEISPRAVSLR